MARDADLFQRFNEICRRRGAVHDDRDGVECATEGDTLEAVTLLPLDPSDGLAKQTRTHRPPPLPPGSTFVTSGYPSNKRDSAEGSKQAWTQVRKELAAEAEVLDVECNEEFSKALSRKLAQFGELCVESAAIEEESDLWNASLWGGLERLRKRVHALGKNMRSAHVGEIQVVSRCVERELESYKAQQRQSFQTLAVEELELQGNLEGYARRFESWLADSFLLAYTPREDGSLSGSRGGARSNSCSSSSSRLRGHSMPPFAADAGGERSVTTGSAAGQAVCGTSVEGSQARETVEDPRIKEFREGMEKLYAEERKAGGPSGGWTTLSHEIFTRILRMFKGQATPAFYERLEERLPDIPRVRLEEHVAWHAEQECRQAERRLLLSRWRARKAELERQAAESEEPSPEDLQRRRQAERHRQQLKAEQRRHVSEWRRQQAEEEDRAAAERRNLEMEQARKLELEQQRQRVAQREAVEVYRRQREVERSTFREASAREARCSSKRAASQEDRKRIANRNLDLLRRKLLSAHEQSQAAAAEAAALASRRTRAYEHVESRLYDNTKCYMQKITNKVATDASPLMVPSSVSDGAEPVAAVASGVQPPRRRPSSAGPGPRPSSAGHGRRPLL
eukprot:TRINITY_DN68711_c0_g1_i1.p1 TRINITY_DN68711_c0_g1~~TRINITY_DN68711_c0_g1_i1.p1  ORF type:complete len:624 (-),score=101.96 TRINITY_DN68711_c0_g1_i1:36-1907(-)